MKLFFRSQNLASMEIQDHFALAVQVKTTGGRDRKSDFGETAMVIILKDEAVR